MEYQDTSFRRGESKDFEVTETAQTSGLRSPKIDLRFPAQKFFYNVLVEISVRLEPELHRRCVWDCCRASSSF